jgi:hypothetical protein
VLVRHLLHTGLEKVALLRQVSSCYCEVMRTHSYLFLRPRTVSSRRHLAGSQIRHGRRVRIHLVERGEDLGLMVKHDVLVACSIILLVVVVGSKFS